MSLSFRAFVFGALALCLPACASSSFDQNWKRAAASPTPKDPLGGRWEGRWMSAKHKNSGGRLQALVTPSAPSGAPHAGSAAYQAAFKAHWMVFDSTYSVPLTVLPAGRERVRFSGTHTLPAFGGGQYRFEGTATPEHFSSSYDSSYDHGRFEMTRVH